MPSLTRIEAAERGALLRVRSYDVDLDLTTAIETFRSRTTIAFDADRPHATTFLDVRPDALVSVALNGRQLDVATLADGRLPLTDLARENEVVVTADMSYSNECEGMHRYVDPVDGQTYVYAFAYIDNAPRIFACFDQPDLKAPYTFAVTAPEGWQVLGNSAATRIDRGRWELASTVPLSTYLTTLIAGPYESFHTEHDGVPLGLHCRASLAESLKPDVDEVLEITAQCLDECHRLFGVRYPFGKFDQVFVPEFSVLSLDHPGCVLLREQYLFRSAATASERETRAVVLAHGISLMWLAGLVTNKWWDDLWLGQAFADYMAHRLTSEVTRFPGPLTTFSARRKGQAYAADQRPSTHPVCLEGSDVQTVLLELDRISYFRGSSVLRQLATRIGDDALRASLRRYFARHAYGSATFGDFLAAINAASKSDLTDWATKWLMQPDVNTLEPDITVADGRIATAAVIQMAPPNHPILRPHTLDIGLYGPEERATIRVNVDGARTELPELVGRPAPRFVLLNDGDLTYAKLRLDARSQAALPDVMPDLSARNRAMLWCALLLAVQDGVFAAADHLDLVSKMIGYESELSIVAEVLEQARNDVADRFLNPGLRTAALSRVAESIRNRLAGTTAGDEMQLTLFRGLVEFSSDMDELTAYTRGTGLPDGLGLDLDLVWRIRYRLAVLGALSQADIVAMYEADPNAHSEQFAAKSEAARPDPATKRSAWETIMTDTTVSSYRLWALAEGFWQPEQLALTAPYVERFFAEMPRAATLRGDLVLDLLVRHLYPRHAASPDTLRMAGEMLARTDITVPLRRRVVDFTDDLRRVVEARAARPR